jgi:hypothetical protein
MTNRLPGFTAENTLARRETSHRIMSGNDSQNSLGVLPQMSCWRTCYDISDTNHELSQCYRVCSQIKRIFDL